MAGLRLLKETVVLYCRQILLALVFIGCGFLAIDSHARATDFVAAKLTENLNSKRVKKVSSANRLEGWVYMSFVVGIDGMPKGIEVVDRSSKGYDLDVAFKIVDNLRFSPATYLGKPVESVRTQFVSHKISFYGSNNQGITPGFRNRYEKINELIAQGKLAQAKEELERVEQTNSKNLTEQALSAWLHSKFYSRQKMWPQYGDAVQAAERLRDYLPTKMAIENAQNLLSYHSFKQQYGDAIYTAYNMRGIENAELDEATLQQILKPLIARIAADEALIVTTRLFKDQTWMHTLPRQRFALSYKGGVVQQLELRCRNGWKLLSVKQAQPFEIPAGYFGCMLLVKGQEGTEISLTETGNPIGL